MTRFGTARRGREDNASSPSPLAIGAAVVGALGTSALWNDHAAHEAEHRHPPRGRFLRVRDVRLHVLDSDPWVRHPAPVVLLHGNGACVEDWQASGLYDRLRAERRVIAFDRPGFGHSNRPGHTRWTPEAQADLIVQTFDGLGIDRAIVVGHSWGAMVAAALAIRHPGRVAKAVLASGYYFPTARQEVMLFSSMAMPLIGNVMRQTVSPLLARMTAPRVIKTIFAPRPVDPRFTAGFPLELCFRPSQLRALAEDTDMMVPAARRLARDYAGIAVPVEIVTGDADRICDPARQSLALAKVVPDQRLTVVEGGGHMVHYDATETFAEVITR